MRTKITGVGKSSPGHLGRGAPLTIAMVLIVAAALFLTAAAGYAQTLATDKTTYQPGEKVLISGEGWPPQEAISLTIGNTSGTRPTVAITVTAGPEGTFTDGTFVVQELDRDQMLVLNARAASGAQAIIAFKAGVAPGVLTCSSLNRTDGGYATSPWEKVTCTIDGASDLSANQQAGIEPVQVLVRNKALGDQPATVVAVTGTTITFQYTAPASACDRSIVSYGPLRVCNPGNGRCTTFPAQGNDVATGFTYLNAGSPVVCPDPKLRLEMIAQNGSFSQGARLSYKMVVSNPALAGGAWANNVRLIDELPGKGGLTWQQVTPSQGTCVNPVVNNTLECALGDIPPQGAVTVTVTSSDVTPDGACQQQCNADAVATADGGATARASGSLSCTPPPQLRVVTTPDDGVFKQYSFVIFTMVVTNSAPEGSGSATNASLTAQLTANGGLTWSFASPGNCTLSNNYLSCPLGDIPPGDSRTVRVYSTGTTPVTACQYQRAVASATADGGLKAEDSGSATCVGMLSPLLKVAVTPDSGLFQEGGVVSYSIVISNPSTVTSATNVQLNDVLPTNGGLTWAGVSTTQGGCSITNNTLNCGLGTIPMGQSVAVTVSTPTTTPSAACMDQPNFAAVVTADGGFKVQDSGYQSCLGAQLRMVKTPDKGVFQQGGQASFTIVVKNPAPIGNSAARNVKLTDQLPIAGGLTWTSATTTQGKCSIVADKLSCELGDIAAGGAVTVVVSTPVATPAAACQYHQSVNALAVADGGLYAHDVASLVCSVPCSIPVLTTSWNSFKIPQGTSPVVWVHAHIGKPSGVPTTTRSTVRFTGMFIDLNGKKYPLPDGHLVFDPAAPETITTTWKGNAWETLVNPSTMSDEIFFTGGAIPVTPEVAEGAKAIISYGLNTDISALSFAWQWSAAAYTYWPSDWNQASIRPYHDSYHAGAPLNPRVQDSLIQGPRGGAGSNFTGSWSATGNGTCSGQTLPDYEQPD